MTNIKKQEYSRTNYRHSLHTTLSLDFIEAEKGNVALGKAGKLTRGERRAALKALKKAGHSDPEATLDKVMLGAGDPVEYLEPRSPLR